VPRSHQQEAFPAAIQAAPNFNPDKNTIIIKEPFRLAAENNFLYTNREKDRDENKPKNKGL
jgi:hypothetical protein